MKSILRHLSSWIAPVVMCLVVPYFILSIETQSFANPILAASIAQQTMGLILLITGFILFLLTVRMFILIGKGTIMPWDPTRNLITSSLYSHVRNPMILSVMLVLVGEAVLFASAGIALLVILFFVINTIYFMVSEEPGLESRFGKEYVEYKKIVPRWIPRLKPRKPN